MVERGHYLQPVDLLLNFRFAILLLYAHGEVIYTLKLNYLVGKTGI